MRLSEAIRLGGMLHPQCFNTTTVLVDGDIVATCAVYGAVLAGYRPSFANLLFATCPVGRCGALCATHQSAVPIVAVHLNDWHRWTCEQIAAWVETRERADARAAPHERSAESQAVAAVARTRDLVTG